MCLRGTVEVIKFGFTFTMESVFFTIPLLDETFPIILVLPKAGRGRNKGRASRRTGGLKDGGNRRSK
jgi:hypothetical protein